ncbi:MAG: SRPBCC family protein [Actinomycetota bacterium]|nr:SRPBCC family protein [Actinomycetota bacterium]
MTRTIKIDADRKSVFKLIGDPERYPDFFVGITRWESLSRTKRAAAARYRVLMKVGSIEAGGIIRVERWEEPELITWTWERGIHQEGRWQLSEVAGGTDLTFEVGFDLSGGPVGLLVEQLAGRIVRRNMWATLLAARRLIELENRTG